VWQIYSNQKPTLYADPPALADAVARGDSAIAIGLSGFEGAAAAGAPIKVLRFADTPIVNNITAFGILKNARHPNAAMLFINWALSKEGHEFITKTAHYQSIRTDVPDGLAEALADVELVGGTKKGPAYVIAPVHAVFSAELHNKNEIWRQLPTGVGETEFVNTLNSFISDWEATNGGPKHDAIALVEK
jgi:ABC-type Fe3+ transport system substrate-binding protein